MALQPLLKVKVDELFLLWLSEPETQELLRSNMNQMLHGEPITRPASQLIASRTSGSINRQSNSPRGRMMTLGSAPPYSPANGVSPRSPRPKNISSKSRSSSGNSLVCKCILFK
jgi:serine/threonine-protein phosphatase 2A regulatory subunit B''